jgi:hypothetical protein
MIALGRSCGYVRHPYQLELHNERLAPTCTSAERPHPPLTHSDSGTLSWTALYSGMRPHAWMNKDETTRVRGSSR